MAAVRADSHMRDTVCDLTCKSRLVDFYVLLDVARAMT